MKFYEICWTVDRGSVVFNHRRVEFGADHHEAMERIFADHFMASVTRFSMVEIEEPVLKLDLKGPDALKVMAFLKDHGIEAA